MKLGRLTLILARVTVRHLVAAVPPVGVKVVQSRTFTAAFLRAAWVAEVALQMMETVRALVTVRGRVMQAVIRLPPEVRVPV